MPKKPKKYVPPPTFDAVDKVGIEMLAPARATAQRIGINAFTLQLCQKCGWDFVPNRVAQVKRALSTEPSVFMHPRAGFARLMLEVK